MAVTVKIMGIVENEPLCSLFRDLFERWLLCGGEKIRRQLEEQM